MKTAQEILEKHCPFKNVSGNTEYFTKEILEAMEEYATQSNSIEDNHPRTNYGEGYYEKAKQETTLEEYLQICKDCGSKEVARCKWVNVNTEEIYSAYSGTNLEWCFNCKSETNIINKEDYETKIQ